MSSGLLKCFVFVLFCIFCLPNILKKVLEHFPRSSFYLILAQYFAPFDCLHFLRCNFSCKFLVICLNSCLKFYCKVLSLYVSEEILIFSCKVLFLEKVGTYFFSAGFCIIQPVTCGGDVIFHILRTILCQGLPELVD